MVVLFMTLTNSMQLICWKVICLVNVDIYKMHFKEINIQNSIYKYYFDNLISAKKKIETIRIWRSIN